MTARSRTCASAVTIVLGAVVLTSACSDPKATPPTSSTASSTTTATPTTATTTSTEDEATARAERMVTTYFRAKDESLFDPAQFQTQNYESVAISSELTNLKNLHSAAVSQRLKQRGYTQVVSVLNPRVDFTNKPKATPPEVPTVQFDVCYDVSKVNIVDSAGVSVVPASRAPRGVMLLGISNYNYPAPGQWRVSFTEVQEGKKC